MENNISIKDRIMALEPSSQWSDAGDGMLTVPVQSFRKVAEHLKNDAGFDYLRSLTGVDWGEDGLGCVYHLENTATGENIALRTSSAARENAVLPSVHDLWKGADLNEREAYDYLGIKFIGHPDLRRLYLRDDWKGYPLRKDYDPSWNGIPEDNEETNDDAPSYEVTGDGSFILKRHPLFEDDEYVINIGPQHPATHGVLRFRVSLEGEIIRKLDVHCGYIHRGIEKMCESMTYRRPSA